MRVRILLGFAAAVLLAGIGWLYVSRYDAHSTVHAAAEVSTDVRGRLPNPAMARSILDLTVRHSEWAEIPVGTTVVPAFLAYPDRSNKAPVVMITSNGQGMSDWVRAVSDQVAADGFIAVAPDLRGDAIKSDVAAVRDFVETAVPLANGEFASLDLSPNTAGTTRVDVVAGSGKQSKNATSFTVTPETWPTVIQYLDRATSNRPEGVPAATEIHAAEMDMGAMAMNDMGTNISPGDGIMMDLAVAQEQARSQGLMNGQVTDPSIATHDPHGVMTYKRPDVPASAYTSHATMLHTTMKGEWVNVPVGNVQVHVWISYPNTPEKATVVEFISGNTGMWEDFPQAAADQLAREGFIGVTADLRSGQGPNGGNFDWHFPHVADGVGPGNLGPGEDLRRVKAALDYALKLPQSNGKSAVIGICAAGTTAWQVAASMPYVSVAVSMYGEPIPEADRAKVTVPIWTFQGEYDGRTALEAPEVAESMKRLGKEFHYTNYPRVTHGYMTQQNIADNYTAVVDSWHKSINFIREKTAEPKAPAAKQ